MPPPLERFFSFTDRDGQATVWGSLHRSGLKVENAAAIIDLPDLQIPRGYLLWPTAVTVQVSSSTAIPIQLAFSVLDSAQNILSTPGVERINPPLAGAQIYAATFRPDIVVPPDGSLRFVGSFGAAGITNTLLWDITGFITSRGNYALF